MSKYTEEEIKLLDQFAGQAMQGEITRLTEGYTFDYIATNSYMAAIAMLKARKEVLKNEQCICKGSCKR